MAIAARDQKLQAPVHQVLIYPVAGIDMTTPSYEANANAKPLSKAMMGWFVEKFLAKPEEKDSPMLDIVGKAKLENLPSTTVITAQIDPLRSEGQALADKLKAAGVSTEAKGYEGAAHEFFGMAVAVQDAADAQLFVSQRLKESFGP